MGCTSSAPIDDAAARQSKELEKVIKEVSYLFRDQNQQIPGLDSLKKR